MAFSIAQVKELREATGVGMMDCKNALQETDGDMDAAIDWLRSKGLAKAAKKADRVAAEGLVGVTTSGAKGAVVEVNSETDFVARNEEFQALVATVATLGLAGDGDVAALAATAYPDAGKTVAEKITDTVAKIGENMALRRSAVIEVSSGVVGSYVHSQIADGLGKIGVLVGLESTGDAAALQAIGRQVAMHIAAIDPLALSAEEIDPDVVARERAVFTEQAGQSGKPAEIVEKMVDGKMRKFFEESCLLSQSFAVNADLTVAGAVKAAEADVGAPIKVTGFVRFALGEGVEKQESDFAAEVAAAAGTA